MRYHYLDHNHHNGARVYIAEINGEPCGFISILHFPHPKLKNHKRVHRLVVLPEYQGIGIGIRLLNWAGEFTKAKGGTLNIVTSNPALYKTMSKSSKWSLTHKGRKGKNNIQSMGKAASSHRYTVSFRYR